MAGYRWAPWARGSGPGVLGANRLPFRHRSRHRAVRDRRMRRLLRFQPGAPDSTGCEIPCVVDLLLPSKPQLELSGCKCGEWWEPEYGHPADRPAHRAHAVRAKMVGPSAREVWRGS